MGAEEIITAIVIFVPALLSLEIYHLWGSALGWLAAIGMSFGLWRRSIPAA